VCEYSCVCVCLSEGVIVGWIPSVCRVHTEGEIYSPVLKGYDLVIESSCCTSSAL